MVKLREHLAKSPNLLQHEETCVHLCSKNGGNEAIRSQVLSQ